MIIVSLHIGPQSGGKRGTIMGEKRKPATICIQSGWKPKNGEPRVLPIYQSTTFKYETSEQMGRLFDLEEDGYFYTRLANPTNDAVAEKICELEGGVAAMLTSSGQAANNDLRRNLQPVYRYDEKTGD